MMFPVLSLRKVSRQVLLIEDALVPYPLQPTWKA
jgi:hypothetical protein